MQQALATRDAQLSYVAKELGYRSVRHYQFRTDFLFRGLSLSGRRVLDVGCGTGAIALWTGLHGAAYTLGLEPEADGSTPAALRKLHGLIHELGLEGPVDATGAFLEQLPPPEKPFDIAILYNVINHLNEPATMRLHQDERAGDEFLPPLTHLRRLLSNDAIVVVADCARHNFWHQIGLQGPLTPTIEWDKHQEPETWARVFSKAGFDLYDLRWSPLSPLYALGDLTSLRLIQYFAASHFVLRFRRRSQ